MDHVSLINTLLAADISGRPSPRQLPLSEEYTDPLGRGPLAWDRDGGGCIPAVSLLCLPQTQHSFR